MTETHHWFSSERMTVYVRIGHGRVVQTAPITRKFLGQPADNLRRWMQRQGGFKEVELGHSDTT